jgi:hypothetical protein
MIEFMIIFFTGLTVLLAIIIVAGYTFIKVQGYMESLERSDDD